MTTQLAALLLVLLLPLFVGSWRVSLLGLSLQGLLIGWISTRHHGAADSAVEWLRALDLFVVRGVLVPWLLLRVLRAQQVRARIDVIPPNLLAWAAAIALVLLAFNAAERLLPDGPEQTLVAVAGAGVLLAFLVLATRPGVFGQSIGLLRLQNAIALFELGTPESGLSAFGALMHLALYLGTVALLLRFLAALGAEAAPPVAEDTL